MAFFLVDLHPQRKIRSVQEQRELEQQIALILDDGIAQEVPVERHEYAYMDEHWYRETKSGVVYRYVVPNFPALGIWERVSQA